MRICNLEFTNNLPGKRCGLEEFLPENCLYYPFPDGGLYAVSAKIGVEPHPLLYFSEAAIYHDGFWLVGIDILKNEYFTPLFRTAE